MIKRLFTLIVGIILVCPVSWADKEIDITLEKGVPQGHTEALPYGEISFRLVEDGNYHRVYVSIDNTNTSEAILLFKNSQGEKELKKNKPKIEFEKSYPGSKGKRSVFGCKALDQAFVSVIPGKKIDDLFGFDVSSPSVTTLELPIYLAKYNPKQERKKGAYKINYKILAEYILTFKITIKGWSENDPDYVAAKNAVADYIRSVNAAAFCKNKKHRTSLSVQQKPYREKKDSLLNLIDSTLKNHPEWYSIDEPHIKYTELHTLLKNVNLNERTYDCGEHRGGSRRHSCGYCSLSPQQIYHQLDDIYQQLRNGKITKDAAVKKAQGLYVCHQKNSKRKRNASYSDKISRFYNRIANY